MRILKLLHIYIFEVIFVSFLYQSVEVKKVNLWTRNRFRYYFFLSTNIERIAIYMEDEQIQLILPAKSSNYGSGGTQFPRWEMLD